MARSYGQIMSAIWNDPDFRALTGAAQRAYLMLVTQADISSAGVLSLTVGRWSKYAIDTPLDTVWQALSVLEQSAYTAHDDDTEELLVRKFVKWDGGYTNPLRRKAITAAANAVVSLPLRAMLAVELNLLGVEHGLSDTPSYTPSDTPSYTPWHTPRVVVTEGEYVPQPTTPILEREPRASDDARPSGYCSKHPNGTDQPCGPCGSAAKRLAQWIKDEPRRIAQARARVENCSRCHGGIWLEDGTKCDHKASA